MGYWQEEDQPFYYSLAREFPIGDAYHCSVLGQTYPNRRYLLAATSIGQVNDTLPSLTDYPPNGTIFDQLDAHGITWKDYCTDLATTELYPPLYLKNVGSKVVPIAGFFADAAAGTLPGYCLVEPNYSTQSEENPQNIAVGEAFAASVINAVINGPAWDKTLLMWTYDEHGGYYDHVPPPAAVPPDSIAPQVPSGQSAYDGFARLGFRVPFAVVSPWARRHHVSHVVYDHTSILKLVETKWNLPALTYRDANANAPLDMLDLRRPSFAEPPALAQPLLDTDSSALACSTSGPGTIPPPGTVTGPGTCGTSRSSSSRGGVRESAGRRRHQAAREPRTSTHALFSVVGIPGPELQAGEDVNSRASMLLLPARSSHWATVAASASPNPPGPARHGTAGTIPGQREPS
jgi:phospholipase C